MSTHTQHNQIDTAYFCTLTCFQWLPLFDEANAYESVYTWFHHLKAHGCLVLGYVIMPNHLHCILFPTDPKKSLNYLVGEGKRFMAYDIVKRLVKLEKHELLTRLQDGVSFTELSKNKKHQVFRLSFDARMCFNEKMLEQKLDYIHTNPVMGKWNLVSDYVSYSHSSASFYELASHNQWLTHYKGIN